MLRLQYLRLYQNDMDHQDKTTMLTTVWFTVWYENEAYYIKYNRTSLIKHLGNKANLPLLSNFQSHKIDRYVYPFRAWWYPRHPLSEYWWCLEASYKYFHFFSQISKYLTKNIFCMVKKLYQNQFCYTVFSPIFQL